ncbi:hypothetical protein [Frigoribacterium sp. VKM Ac-2530]|uniref:hypothetical protein n=1 Tax=Frigoribacterium sp. VKM Ac-2530 TaxID=2783822 RepID=UPI00188D23EF|nr:hypothetical protein [Frigoribacterium sp. VKM Ac-2530]MBF4580236.1 hypothetical protein [Frigoribacterium sp. VKM Ac-2530]
MRERTRRYRQTVAAVLTVLTAVDPYGLEPGTPEGPPADEYEPEALDLARVLLAEGAVTVRDVEDVWAHWFSESLVLRLGVDRMARLVDELNALAPAAGTTGLPRRGA